MVGKLLATGDVNRVTTPTARVYRTAPESLVNGTAKVLTPDSKIWDNNVFWNPAANPTRLTVRSGGVYLVGAQLEYNGITSGRRVVILRANGVDIISDNSLSVSNTNLVRPSTASIWAFEADDYVECLAFANANGVTAELENFWIVAITPEAVI